MFVQYITYISIYLYVIYVHLDYAETFRKLLNKGKKKRSIGMISRGVNILLLVDGLRA